MTRYQWAIRAAIYMSRCRVLTAAGDDASALDQWRYAKHCRWTGKDLPRRGGALLLDVWTTRFSCVRKAARWCHLATGEMADDAAWALSWAARWREAGQSLPLRIDLGCARARRRHRRRVAMRRAACAAGHDYQNAEDYTGNMFCSRCGEQG